MTLNVPLFPSPVGRGGMLFIPGTPKTLNELPAAIEARNGFAATPPVI